jgi:galactokinase
VLPLPLAQRTTITLTLRDDAAVLPASPYVEAVARVLGVAGFEATIESDVPQGAGLGSSSALTVALALALSDAFSLGLSDRDAALAAWRAESVEMGVGSGVMDQLAAIGREGEALLIDCRSLDVRAIPVPDGADVRVVGSGVRHENLAAEGYGARVAECRRAAELLGVESLRDATADSAAGLPAPLDRRARHVVEENARVLAAADALSRGDLAELGSLMTASHASQRDLYEVSVPEVDALVDRLLGEGALGARLTGGGFGGSVVALFAG